MGLLMVWSKEGRRWGRGMSRIERRGKDWGVDVDVEVEVRGDVISL